MPGELQSRCFRTAKIAKKNKIIRKRPECDAIDLAFLAHLAVRLDFAVLLANVQKESPEVAFRREICVKSGSEQAMEVGPASSRTNADDSIWSTPP
jgi:hypothetical protein